MLKKSIIMRRKFLYIYSLSVLGLLSLQSCFVAKDYKQPDIVQETVDEDLYRTDNLATDSLSMADLSWKDIFKDPILQDYIDEGLNNNLDNRIALQKKKTEKNLYIKKNLQYI